MSIVEKLTKSMDVRQVLEELNFSGIKSAGSEYRSACECHGGDNPTSFVINKHTGLYYCHSNHCSGDIYDLIMTIEEIGFADAVKWLAHLQGITDIDWETEHIDENYFRDEAKKFIELMMKKANKKELPSWEPRGMTFEPISEYRGYSPETIAHWGIQRCLSGDLVDRVVIPLEDVENRLVGMTGRATLETQDSKYFHRPRALHTGWFLTGLGRNIEYVREASNSVIINEGIMDSAKWWECGYKFTCCPIGVFITEEHIDQLFRAGVTTVYIAFDADRAGRNGARKAMKLLKNKFEIYILDYPEGRDADECCQSELDEVFKNRLAPWEWLEKWGEAVEK